MENAKQRRNRKAREATERTARQKVINGYLSLQPEREEYARISPCIIGTVKPSSRDTSQTMDGCAERAATEWVNANVTDGNTTLTDEAVAKLRRQVVNANAQTVKRSAVSPKTPDEIAAQRGKHKSTVGVNPWCGCMK